MASSSARMAKRRRTISRYNPGAIVRVEVNNFMTYAHAVVEPGPRLNLILGPNGSGKSSFLFALAVGLAGNVRLLGGAEDLSSYVRRGTSDGWVEVTLAGQDEVEEYRIKRKIFAASNSSEWFINGRNALLRDVTELTGRFNIRLGNLCQFMPQDRVSDFARMKPEELLRATESAVGDSALADSHEKLILLKASVTKLQEEKDHLSGTLERLRQENARIERAAHQIRQREALLEEAKMIDRKIPWVKYLHACDEHRQIMAKLEDEQENLAALKKRQQSYERPLLQIMKEVGDTKSRRAKAFARLEAARRGCSEFDVGAATSSRSKNNRFKEFMHGSNGLYPLESCVLKMEEMINERNDLQKRSNEWQATIQQLEKDVDNWRRKEAEHLEEESRLKATLQHRTTRNMTIKDLSNEEVALRQSMEDLRSESGKLRVIEHQARAKLQHLNDRNYQRLQTLERQNYNHGIVAAYNWVQSNKARFRGNVYGPLAMEVKVENARYAATVEQHIPGIWWSRFFVEFEEDLNLLNEELKRYCNYEANISHYRGDSSRPLKYPLGQSQRFSEFGVVATLDEIFEAPNLIKHALNDNFYISSTFIMSDMSTHDDWDRFFEHQPKAQVIWTKDAQIRHNVSLYNPNAKSRVFNHLRPAKILNAHVGDANAVQTEQNIIDRATNESIRLQDELSSKSLELEDVRNRKQRLVKEDNELSRKTKLLENRRREIVAMKKAKLKQLEEEKARPDPLSRGPQVEKDIEEFFKAGREVVKAVSEAYCTIPEALSNACAADVSVKMLEDQLRELERQAKQQKEQIHRCQKDIDGLEIVGRHKIVARDRCKGDVDAICGWPLTPDLEEAFRQLPDDVEELRMLAQEKKDRADEYVISDHDALERWRRKCDEITRKEGSLAETSQKLEDEHGRMVELKTDWISELRRIVVMINESFSQSFPLVGCAGEVVLVEDPNEDFSNYALEIRVKFRENEELATLNACRQSGGERSVSTMLFIIALQSIAAAPFRVIDEINQGMDQRNERNVFLLLVQAAMRPDTPQLFLLTPKLLSSLPFSKDVTVLQIMNGPHSNGVAQGFSMEKLLGQKRVQELECAS